jgi:peptide/nickel transport system substrate-binding protein
LPHLPALLSFSGRNAGIPRQEYTIGEGQFIPDNFIGTGPYKLASFTSDAIRLDVNEDYWGEKPANEGIDIQIFTNARPTSTTPSPPGGSMWPTKP